MNANDLVIHTEELSKSFGKIHALKFPASGRKVIKAKKEKEFAMT